MHEPLAAGEDALPPLGNEELAAELRSRVVHSRGGTFLVTGFRGVGKSTLVLRTLQEITERSAPGELVLPVSLSVARSTTTERLLFAMVRRIFETLSDSGVLDRLPPETGQSLLLAYMRTSLSFKETQSDARERSAALDLGAGTGAGAKALVNAVTPKINLTVRNTRSLATEAAFLAYSETDVEHDLMRIVSLINQDAPLLPRPRSRLRRLWPWPRPAPSRLRLVVVLDEVDKLTVDEAGREAVENLLSGTKNVLTMAGAHFLIVAGPDLHDRALSDAARGNGVYESVFGWHMYVPCSWDAPDRLLADVVEPGAEVDPDELQRLIHYLRFKARGVPRRLLQEFNRFVRWEGDRPYLRVDEENAKRVAFFARLEGVLRRFFERGGHERLFPVAIDEDRWRLGGYYVVDRVLQSDGAPFSAGEILREGDDDAAFDPLLRISRRNVDRLLDHLADEGVLEVAREFNSSATMIGDVPSAQDKVYRLAAEVRRSLFGIAMRHESERGAMEISLAGPRPSPRPAESRGELTESRSEWIPAAHQPRLLAGRYELRESIGQGGMGSVWHAYDRLYARMVAVKMLLPHLTDQPLMVARARREAELAVRLRHPQIVESYDVVDGADGTPAIVMELLDGPTLRDLVTDRGPLAAAEVVRLLHRLTGALEYLAEQGIVRLDLKPQNVIMPRPDWPVIVDLGIARVMDDNTPITHGGVIGTPRYMSPEQVRGETPDPRTDLYALGLVAYFCLAGEHPWAGKHDMAAIFHEVLNGTPDLSGLPVSPSLRRALSRALEPDRERRTPDARALREDLEATPEWLDAHTRHGGEG
ncbi:hypothetical protein GCM10010411_21620 [Actinomadura fulvescens]|uniref:non-specific serine/threonine protein kinase n=1 Tax=Actinomadura fulvescens TaxID=46160 RepID=A0ABP6BUP7_9ACTN